MNQIKHQFEMSSSSTVRSSKASSKTSSSVPVGTRRFPDGFVGPADMPFCKVCYDAGCSVADYTDHFVKDQPGPDGKVVCPTLLAQKCLTCNLAGHTSSYCPEKLHHEREHLDRERQQRERVKKSVALGQSRETVGKASSSSSKPRSRIEDMHPTKTENSKSTPVAAPPRKTYGGSFGVLAVDDSSSEDERQQATIQKIPVPVTVTVPVPVPAPSRADVPNKPLTWAQRAAAAATNPTPASSSSSRKGVAPSSFSDTRFQLHELCQNIEPSKRASSSKRPGPPVSAESSMKRKQESVSVPA